MKNYEKYKDKIKGYEFNTDGGYFCNEFIMPYILKKDNCDGIGCEHCHILQIIWLLEDYEEPKEEPKEPEIDWSKIEVDTPVLVKDKENEEWKKRHFAKYEYGRVHVWNNGSTSWSACRMYDYKYAKLPEDEKKPEIDWSKVAVDTPILVRQGKNGTWLERHFAKYENGDVYAWVDGQTSWTGKDEIKWKYAKLAEGEKKCEESEVDWAKVKVDTPILVRDSEDSKWLERYFAKYEDGLVYAWLGENTSYDACGAAKWKYAKLAESEEENI